MAPSARGKSACVKFRKLIVVGREAPPRVSRGRSRGAIDCQQFVEVELGNGAQFLRLPGSFHAF
jgi:hypothetical protein